MSEAGMSARVVERGVRRSFRDHVIVVGCGIIDAVVKSVTFIISGAIFTWWRGDSVCCRTDHQGCVGRCDVGDHLLDAGGGVENLLDDLGTEEFVILRYNETKFFMILEKVL